MGALLKIFIKSFIGASVAAGTLILITAVYLNSNLPDVELLKDVRLQVPLKIYSADGKLIAEYGEKRRTPIKLEDVPQDLINAVIATEDCRFFEHFGVDLRSVARAIMTTIKKGEKKEGASTITMQVARNFFFSSTKTYTRKLNETLLALKIERELSKNDILELYLNKIFLGKRAYGIAAAAEVYYGKEINQLDLSEMAMLAGLPQAPSKNNPINNPDSAMKRRNRVLSQMLKYGYLDDKRYNQAINSPITARYHKRTIELNAPYIAEMVRSELQELYNEDVYDLGLEVYTTIDSKMQSYAQNALFRGVIEYDSRHGYRGPIKKLGVPKDKTADEIFENWIEELEQTKNISKLVPGIVTNIKEDSISIFLKNKEYTTIEWDSLKWAKKLNDKKKYISPESPEDIVEVGDLIYAYKKNKKWHLSQQPEVEAALISMNPNTGAILSLVGGFDYWHSKFNRAIQAKRQPGSSFKPFIYSAALEKGFTLASIINDAPIIQAGPIGDYEWRPQNFTKRFYGPSRLKLGLTKSRNLISIRLLKAIGLENAIEAVSKFGFDADELPHGLSLALGSGSVPPIKITAGYCSFANGGSKVNSHIISKITDYFGKTIYETTIPTICNDCKKDILSSEEEKYINYADRVISPQVAYLITSALQDAIQTGTGRGLKTLGRKDLSGKTGTTNDLFDAWYSGYNKDLVVTTWIGYDEPKSLKEPAPAATAALPMWKYFVEKALKGVPENPPIQPDNMINVKINPKTGEVATNDSDGIYEIFRTEYAPKLEQKTYSSSKEIIKESSLESLF